MKVRIGLYEKGSMNNENSGRNACLRINAPNVFGHLLISSFDAIPRIVCGFIILEKGSGKLKDSSYILFSPDRTYLCENRSYIATEKE